MSRRTIGVVSMSVGLTASIVIALLVVRSTEPESPAPERTAVTRSEAAPTTPAPPAPPAPQLFEVEATLGRGQTLVGSLASHGISGTMAHVISTQMAGVFNFRYARAGDSYHLVQTQEGTLVRFDFVRGPLESYVLKLEGGAFVAERTEPDLVRSDARVAGIVTDSLYQSFEALGAEAELASDFADIFAWDLDFSRAVQPGDEFAMVYERVNLRADDGELEYVHPGRILAARYTNASDDLEAVYFERAEGSGGYYRPDGSSVQRQFLKAPLNYRRISSNYTMSRLHPILKVRRPHQGIDYAADVGTPVWSVADGVVLARGWAGGYGKLVKIRHSNGYVSQYGHLSRYATNLRVGQRVAQKQVIGYVGSTGVATGPHLDFRLKRNGQYVNPSLLRTPAGDPIPPSVMPIFEARVAELSARLDPTPELVTNEAL
jgi:murein DD-endopeptidase MepM/ murein hydrolase activator NlpD